MDNALYPQKTSLAAVTSWATFVIACGCLAFLAWNVSTDRRIFVGLFNDFEVELPSSTRLILAIPDLAFPAVAVLLATAMLAVQWFACEKRNATVFHMFVIAVSCLAFVAYRESLIRPLVSLIDALSGR